MEIRQVSAIHGWYWIVQGFQMFRKAPMVWMLICFIPFLIVITLSLLIPMAGPLIFMLIAPVFLAGIMVACRDQEQGRKIEVSHLFIGFKTRTAPLITVGGIFLVGLVVIYSVFLSTGGSDLIAMLERGKRYDSSEIGGISSNILSSFLMVILLQIPLLMAFIFSPVLIILHNFSPVNAMKKSFLACIRNIIPFFVYNIILNLLSIIVLLVPYIGLVILSPVLFASIYVSYKEILLGEPVKVPADDYYSAADYQKATWSDSEEESVRQEQDNAPATKRTTMDSTEQVARTEKKTEILEGDIVQCYQCDILIPKEEAIRFDGKYFCSSEHFQEYQNSMSARSEK
jgi:uncharacterized membrane protein